MKQPRSFLKSLFGANKTPTEADYADMLDSFVHQDEQAAVNDQRINQRLGAYDNDLRAVTAGQSATSFGDLLRAFQGWPNAWKLVEKIGQTAQALTWAQITQKPTALPVRWTEQIVDTYNMPIGTMANGYYTRSGWLAAENGAPGGSTYLVVDVFVQRKTTLFTTNGTSVSNQYAFDGIMRVKLALNPLVNP